MESFADLVNLQIRLEYRLEESGLLIPYPGSAEQAWFICYQKGARTVRFFRKDLPEGLRTRLASLPDDVPFEEQTIVETILGGRLKEKRWTGYAAVISPGEPPGDSSASRLLGKHDLEIARGAEIALGTDNLTALSRRDPGELGNRPVAGAFIDDQLVSVCESVCENGEAAEAWVRTLPQFRRRGLARQVVSKWAMAVCVRGKVPFYSYLDDNLPSRALLRSLAGHDFARVAGYA